MNEDTAIFDVDEGLTWANLYLMRAGTMVDCCWFRPRRGEKQISTRRLVAIIKELVQHLPLDPSRISLAGRGYCRVLRADLLSEGIEVAPPPSGVFGQSGRFWFNPGNEA
jgi:hypothetical protein